MMHVKKYLVEFVATGFFALSIALAAYNPTFLAAPLIAGILFAMFIYIFGYVHMNPAITLGMLSLRKISVRDAAGYIAAQIAGALVALLIGRLFQSSIGSLPAQTQTFAVAAAEAVGAMLLGMGLTAVAYKKVSDSLSGIIAGTALALGIAIAASSGALGILNPAVALTLGAFNLVYVLGPIVGVFIGMQAYKWIVLKRDSATM